MTVEQYSYHSENRSDVLSTVTVFQYYYNKLNDFLVYTQLINSEVLEKPQAIYNEKRP